MRKKAKSAAAAESSMTDMILESISDGVFTVNRDWIITSFNKSAERITGVRRSQAVGSHCFDVFKSNMCAGICPLRKTLKTGKPLINRTGYIINPDGEKKPISVSTALLYDKKGNILGGAETFRDLSELEDLKTQLKNRATLGRMTTNSPAMEKIFRILPAISGSASTVLIQGETGTGKELLARTIHSESPRKEKPFIAINCGALPDALLESELFGYKKGAFTGADKDKPGRFALAKSGTVFLDEIGEISAAMQVKLLRVLQEREYEPLGSVAPEKADVRVICATNRDLSVMVRNNGFRQDLFYRINVVTIKLPSLRERREDIPLLAGEFLRRFNTVMNRNIEGFTPEAYSALYAHDWPGNIRELENAVERAVLLCSGRRIDAVCLDLDASASLPFSGTDTKPLAGAKGTAERVAIIKALEENDGSRIKAARALGIDKATLYRKMAKYGI
jgi:PAS domain S-box-containing protein